MLDEKKVAQMAAFFLYKSGNKLSILKLMKLLYLADRESMARFGFPLSYDHLVSMPHGPVLSETLDYINGCSRSAPGGWDSWVSDRDNHEVSLNKKISSLEKLDALSPCDVDVLEYVWSRFGAWDRWRLREYTHKNCPEWKDPLGSSRPIPYRDVFIALGKTEEEAHELERRIESDHKVDELLARL